MAGSATPGVLYSEVSEGWTPDAPMALVLFHGYGATEQDLAPLGPVLTPALPWAALRAPLGVAPGGYAWFPPIGQPGSSPDGYQSCPARGFARSGTPPQDAIACASSTCTSFWAICHTTARQR